MAGVAGLEPTIHWTKTSCLTTLAIPLQVSQYQILHKKMAGVEGLEPTIHWTRTSCLTIWLYPCNAGWDYYGKSKLSQEVF